MRRSRKPRLHGLRQLYHVFIPANRDDAVRGGTGVRKDRDVTTMGWFGASPPDRFAFQFQRFATGGPFLTRLHPVSMVRAALGGGTVAVFAGTAAEVESMADDARERGNHERPPTDEAALSARLKRLNERLGQLRFHHPSEITPGQRAAGEVSAIARGFRLSTELVAGVLVGAALGWLIDRWLGISPWGMIVLLLLGFAAGVLNVMRAAGVAPPNTLDPPGSQR
jgi:ATP synthase protein I